MHWLLSVGMACCHLLLCQQAAYPGLLKKSLVTKDAAVQLFCSKLPAVSLSAGAQDDVGLACVSPISSWS